MSDRDGHVTVVGEPDSLPLETEYAIPRQGGVRPVPQRTEEVTSAGLPHLALAARDAWRDGCMVRYHNVLLKLYDVVCAELDRLEAPPAPEEPPAPAPLEVKAGYITQGSGA